LFYNIFTVVEQIKRLRRESDYLSPDQTSVLCFHSIFFLYFPVLKHTTYTEYQIRATFNVFASSVGGGLRLAGKASGRKME